MISLLNSVHCILFSSLRIEGSSKYVQYAESEQMLLRVTLEQRRRAKRNAKKPPRRQPSGFLAFLEKFHEKTSACTSLSEVSAASNESCHHGNTSLVIKKVCIHYNRRSCEFVAFVANGTLGSQRCHIISAVDNLHAEQDVNKGSQGEREITTRKRMKHLL